MKVKKKTKINFFKKAKVNKIIFKFLYVVLIINLLYSVIFLINTTITKRKYLHVFNISFFVMKDNSMKGDISKNDLIIVKDIKKDLNVNDIIVYNLKGKIKVNKVINIYNDYATGKKIYTTKSNSNQYPDLEQISLNQVIGKKVYKVPLVGLSVKLLETRLGSLCTFIVLVFMFYNNIYKYKRQKERNRKKKKVIISNKTHKIIKNEKGD